MFSISLPKGWRKPQYVGSRRVYPFCCTMPLCLPFSTFSPFSSTALPAEVGDLLFAFPTSLYAASTKNKQFGRVFLQKWSHSAPQPFPWQLVLQSSLCQSPGILFILLKLHIRPQHAQPRSTQPFIPLVTAFGTLLAFARHRNDAMIIVACLGVLRFPRMEPRQREIPYYRLTFSNIPATMASPWAPPSKFLHACLTSVPSIPLAIPFSVCAYHVQFAVLG